MDAEDIASQHISNLFRAGEKERIRDGEPTLGWSGMKGAVG